MVTTIHRLANGLTIYISTDRTTPRISAWIAVRAGSRHDPAESTGLAHYLEHMLFKGSSRLGTTDHAREKVHIDRIADLYDDLREAKDETGRTEILAEIDSETQKSAAFSVPNEFDNLYARIGITGVNAFTGDEQTVYIADVPSNQFATWAEVEGDRFASPVFRLFYPELEAVYEEKNRTLDSPFGRVFESLLAGLYPAHPYGTQPTIGHLEHLKTPAYADMEAYYQRWYVPNNMAIVLAGDIDATTALPILEETFGGLTPRPVEPPAAAETSRIEKRIARQVVAEGEESVYIAWPTVPVLHPDQAAIEVMDMLVDNARTGLINVHLLLSQELPDAGSGPEFLNEAGFWFMTGTAREGQSVADVEKKLMSIVDRLERGEFTDADIDAIVTNEEIALKERLESNTARVSIMTSAFIGRKSWPDVVAKLDRMRAVTREDVMRVAKQYIGEGRVVVQRRKGRFDPPKIPKPKITPVAIDPSRRSAFAKELEERDVPELEPVFLKEDRDYYRQAGAAGPIIAVPNRRNDLFSLSYRFDLGDRQTPLLCHALDLLEASGAGDLQPEELQRQLYALGTEIDFSCSADHSSIWISGLDRNMEASLDLLASWLAKPRIDKATAEKLVKNTLSTRKDQMEEPLGVASALHHYATRGKGSKYLLAPSNKRLSSATPSAMQKLIVGWPNHAQKISYYGPRAKAELKDLVKLGHSFGAVPAVPMRVYRAVKAPTVYFADNRRPNPR